MTAADEGGKRAPACKSDVKRRKRRHAFRDGRQADMRAKNWWRAALRTAHRYGAHAARRAWGFLHILGHLLKEEEEGMLIIFWQNKARAR
jgi:hypothetical protein